MESKSIIFTRNLPQLDKLHRKWFNNLKKYDDTVMKLFKTKSYKRSVRHQEFISRRMDNYIKKHITDNYWQIVKVQNSNSATERGYALIF